MPKHTDFYPYLMVNALFSASAARQAEAEKIFRADAWNKRNYSGTINFNDAVSQTGLTLEPWLQEQKQRGARRVFRAPASHFLNDKRSSSPDEPTAREWSADKSSGRFLVVAFDHDFALYREDGRSDNSEGGTYNFYFEKRTERRPCLAIRPPHQVADEYRRLLKEMFDMAERGGELRWVNNIRRRLAKLRIEPQPLNDLNEVMMALGYPDGAIRILDAIVNEPYIFEGFEDHNHIALFPPGETAISSRTVYGLICRIMNFEEYAIDTALNALVPGKTV